MKKTIKLEDPNLGAFGLLTLDLKSTAPLVQHRFSEKARKEILDKQMGRAAKKKPPKNPEADFLGSMHVLGKRPKTPAGLGKARYGIPAAAFKAAAVRMAKAADIPMTDARGMFFVLSDEFTGDGGLVEIKSKPPIMHEGYVRIQNTTDIRHRAMFDEWTAKLKVKFNVRGISAEQLTSLFMHAGVANGVGEMRPGGKQSSGDYGTWTVESAVAEIPDLEEETA